MKFLLDENVHRELVPFLTKLGHDVKLSPKSVKNGMVFGLAIDEERILVTRDADFLDSGSFPSSKHLGIWLLRVRPRDLEAQKRAISGLMERVSMPEEYKGRVVKLLPNEDFEFL